MAAKIQSAREGERVPVRGGGGLTSLRDEINRLFDRLPVGRRRADPWLDAWYRDPFAELEWATAGGLGKADLSETDEGYELQIDLPGLKKGDIEIDLSDGVLTVSGERSDEHEDKRKGYYLSERSYGSVRRSFRVPESVDANRIGAEFRDGVLTLKMPRTEEAQKSARRIEIG